LALNGQLNQTKDKSSSVRIHQQLLGKTTRLKTKSKKLLKPRPYHGEVENLYAPGYSSSSKQLIITVKFNAAIKSSQF
jgi:hypothetical protein